MHDVSTNDAAISARGLGICYRRYLTRVSTLKEAVVSMFKGNTYEQFWALRNLDLTLNKGDRLGVVGPNGSGKTTLLKAIAGVLPPSEGKLAVNGRVVPLLGLGAGFKADLTGRENVILNGAIMGVSPQEMRRRFDGIVEFSGVGDFIDAPLSTYSSGMRARLGFAVATDVDAELLLIDEVLAVGDAVFKERAMRRIEKLFGQGTTVVFVSHAIAQVRRLCNRAIYLDEGKVVARGTVEEATDEYMAFVEEQQETEAR